MPFIPYTLLRPRGIGTADSCRSRAVEIVETALGIARVDERFRFSIDTVWAIQAALDGNPATMAALPDLVRSDRLAIGAGWAGVEWQAHPACLVRDIQLGLRALRDAGLATTSYVRYSAGLLASEAVCEASGLERVIPVKGGADGSLRLDNDLGLRFCSDQAVVARDAEREIEQMEGPVPVGEALWCPTQSLISDLLVRASDAGLDDRLQIWDDCEIASSSDAPANTPDWSLALPGVHEALSATTTSLLACERMLSLATLLGESVDVLDDLTDMWKDHLEDLAGMYSGSGDEAKREDLQRSCSGLIARAERHMRLVEEKIAVSVDAGQGPDGIVPIVVFNPATTPTTEPVEAHVVYYGANRATDFRRYEFYKLVDPDGDPIPVEEVSGKQAETAEITIRFVAREVPALGYRTYYLVPKPTEPDAGLAMPIQAPGAMTPDFPEPSFAVQDVEDRISEAKRGLRVARKFTVGHFVLDVDEVTGRIGLFDRDGNVLLDGIRVEAREDDLGSQPGCFAPTGRVLPFSVRQVDLAESGEVSALLVLRGRIASSEVNVSIRLFGDLPYCDVQVELLWQDVDPALIEFCADHKQVSMANTGDFGRSMVVEEGGRSLKIASDRGRCEIDGNTLRWPLLLSTPDQSSYAYNKVWSSYPDRLAYDFRIRLQGEGERADDRPESRLRCRPVYDRATARSRPAEDLTLHIDTDADVVSLRPLDNAVEATLWSESSGCRVAWSGRVENEGREVLLSEEEIAAVGSGSNTQRGQLRTIRLGRTDLK